MKPKRVDGTAYCRRCEKDVEYHLWAGRLYGQSMMDERVCNECGYTINDHGYPQT